MTVVVTGASRGIGLAVAQHLHGRGITVVGLSRTAPTGFPFAQIECDVRKPDQVMTVCREIGRGHEVFGLVNAAGVLYTRGLLQYKENEIEDILETNAIGTINMCRNISKYMIRRKIGRIVNFSSIAASIGLQGDSVYSASKAAVECFSRSIARELWSRNITVNCIAPGPIRTDMTASLPETAFVELVNQQVIRSEFTPADIIPIIDFLLSEGSAPITASVFHIGGY